MKEFFIQFFTKNWQYKLGALLAAVFIWLYVASDQNQFLTMNVPVQLDNFPADMKIINKPANTVEISLTGRRDIINNISKKDIYIDLDMKKASEGRNNFRITSNIIKSLPRGLDIKSITPYQVEIELQRGDKDQKKADK